MSNTERQRLASLAVEDFAAQPLPSQLEKFAAVIGREGAVRIAARFGGRGDLRIPRKPRPGSALVQAIGADAAALLARRFGGEVFAVPAGPGRKLRALEAVAGGDTIRKAARAAGVTERYVYKLLREARGRRERTSAPQ